MNSSVQTLISYNVLFGFDGDAARKELFVQWVKPFAPDVVAYQELHGFTDSSLAEMAAGFGHQYAVKMPGPCPTGLSSRFPITEVALIEEGFTWGCLYGRVGDLHIFCLHLDPFKEATRLEEVARLLEKVRCLPANARVVLVGDFNSLAASDHHAYSHDPEALERGMRTLLPHWRLSYSVTDAILSAGYFDAYKLIHADFKHSVLTKKETLPDIANRRIDFAFLSEGLKAACIGAEIVHDETTHYLSDHYPLLVKFHPR